MKKGKKLISIFMSAVFAAQVFLGSGAALGSRVGETESYAANGTASPKAVKAENGTKAAQKAAVPEPAFSGDTGDKPAAAVKPGDGKPEGGITDMGAGTAAGRKKKNEIIVKYRDISKAGASKAKLISKKPSLRLSSKKLIERFKTETLEVSDSKDIQGTLEQLRDDPNIEYAQPNYALDAYMVPEDPRFQEQWGLLNSGQTVNGQAGAAGLDINAAGAWDITTGSGSVTVAVIDTGTDTGHADLSGNIFVNAGEAPDGIDNDRNGFTDDINGWDFADNDGSVYDSETQDAHGTHVSGIIAAGLNNIGIAGVAPGIKILPLKFINGSTGYTSDAIDAIDYAVSMGAGIINCSWGGSDYNQALRDAMAECTDTLFICSAGNSGSSVDAAPVYPACYQLPNVISVTALDNRGELAVFSNYGSKVDIAAPGAGILSTLPGDSYGFMSGTSMAAPFVTGAAALLKSFDASLTAAGIKERLINNATKEQALSGKVSSGGRPDACAALLNTVPSDSIQPTGTPTPEPGVKPKEPGPIYDTSAGGNSKAPKPLVEGSNRFIDSVAGSGISDGGINDLDIFRLKEKFITLVWTTPVEASTGLYYGSTESAEKSCNSSGMTLKHQITIMEDSGDDIRYYKVRSVAEDGTVFETGVRTVEDDIRELGGSAPAALPASPGEDGGTESTQVVSPMSYVYDNSSNHSFGTAQQIPLCTVFGSVYEGEGSDFYSISLTAGNTYGFDLVGMAEGEDYDLCLYDGSRHPLGYSVNEGRYDENIEYTPSSSGTFYLEVQPYAISSASAHHNYQLMAYAGDMPPDSYEPNDDIRTATAVTSGTAVYATLNINRDEDWFVLDTQRTGKLNITLKSIPSLCDYDLEVYKDGSLLEGSYSNLSNDEKITRLIDTAGKYYIRVYGFTGADASDTYELQAGVCTPDAYELNDNIYNVLSTGSPSIDVGSCTGATIDNPDDTDFYRFTVTDGASIGVRLENIPQGNDYDLAVYSFDHVTGTFVETGHSIQGGSSDETVISQLAAGAYYIKVYSYSGSSETQAYKLSVTDESLGIIKIDFDRTSAAVGDIITATLKVERINYFAAYQVNIKYDPEVVMPVDFNLEPYSSYTAPMGGDILADAKYSPLSQASNDLQKGVLNFGSCYMNINAYRAGGNAETAGSIAVIKFRVLKDNRIQLRFENSESMPGSISGVELFDWNGGIISPVYTVQPPPALNGTMPVNMQAVESSSVDGSDGFELSAFTTYKISGYVVPDFDQGIKSGFKVAVEDSGVYAYTDNNGYFEMDFTPSGQGSFKILITKDNYLRREISDVTVMPDLMIGTQSNPVEMWAGDMLKNGVQDNAINIADIVEIAICFNSRAGSSNYRAGCDLNGDTAVNMLDVVIIAKHFNAAKYGSVKLTSSKFVDIAAAYTWTAGLRGDGTVWNLSKGTKIEGLSDVKAIYADNYYMLALKEDGTVVQANDDGTFSRYTDLTGVKDISINRWHILFLKEDGTLYVNGINNYGQLGIGDGLVDGYETPVRVQGLPEGRVADIAAGEKHSVILMEDGTVWTCGDNYDGALGVADGFKKSTVSITPTYSPDLDWSYHSNFDMYFDFTGYFTAGENFEAYGWDEDRDIIRIKTGTWVNAQINLTDTGGTLAITAAQWGYKRLLRIFRDNLPVNDLDIGIMTAIPINSDGDSSNKYNENIKLNIIIINDLDKKINIELNEKNAKIVNVFERTGTCKLTPVKVEGLTGVKAVYAVGSSSYALKEDGTVWAWGENSKGELDTDGLEDTCTPTLMKDLSGITDIAGGIYYRVALKADGTVWTWGGNYNGTLGQGAYGSYIQNTPVQLESLSGIADVDTGYYHTAALESGGTVWTWGDNGYKQLGDGIYGSKCNPVRLVSPDRSDARLKSIIVDNASIALFNPDTTEYTVILPQGTLDVPWINAVTYDPSAKYRITPAPAVPGTAVIRVTAADGESIRTYTVNFVVSPNPSDTGISFSAKGCIVFGGDTNCYDFTPEATGTYTILSEGSTDTVIDVYDSEYRLVASNDDGEGGRNFYLEVGLTGRQTYHLVVSHFDSREGTGGYIIKIIDAVRTPLDGSYVYLEEVAQEVHGVLSLEQSGIYKVTIDQEHYAEFDGSMYMLDPFNGKAVVRIEDFINAFGGFLPDIISNSDSAQNSQQEWDYRINTENKGAHDRYPWSGDGNVAQIQKVLRSLGCGRKFVSGGSGGVVFQELKITGLYDSDTVDAVKDFKTNFMGMEPGDADGGSINAAAAEELSKYNLVRVIANNQGGGASWLKDSGARVREYLTKCYSPAFTGIFEFEMSGGIPRLYYREFKYAPRVQLKIDGLTYYSDEKKCYAKIKSLERAIGIYNQEKSQLGAGAVGSIIICPGTINVSGEDKRTEPFEFDSIQNYYSSGGILEPYADIREVTEGFNGWTGSAQMVADTVCVAQFYDYDSSLVRLYFDTENNTVRDARNRIISGIEFVPFSDPYAENRLRVNVRQMAEYLGFNNIYSVKRDDGSMQLCIDATRIAKESIGLASICSMTVSTLPGAGDYVDAQQAITGIDLITGERLTAGERVLTAVCVFIPLISGKAVRVVKKGYIKAATRAVAESAVSIKTLLKSSVERVFEKVKSVTRVNDKLIVATTEGEQFNFSRLQIKSELMADGMSGEAAEDVLKCLEGGCFSGDTFVSIKNGLKRIDEINEGDYVLSKDVNSGTIDYRQVKKVYIKSTYEFVHLKLEGEEIRTTASHLFFTDSGWWKAAGNLKAGDRILTAKGELKEVTATSVETLQQPERIYNLNVDEFHTYFVGSQRLLVHNNCTPQVTEAISHGNLDYIVNGFESPQGIIYNVTADENRIEHVLAHGVPDLTKPEHSVFNVANKDIIPLVDEAWSNRTGTNVIKVIQPNGNEYFDIPMGRVIGTAGQTSIRVVVEQGTRVIVTAFPI